MSIRVSCNNGHKFTVGPEFLQGDRKCPKCGGEISWSFRLRCSRGHSLKVPGKYAGQKGKCPQCGEAVRVPDVPDAESAETLVSNLLQGNDKVDADESDIIGGGTSASVPAWQSALAELGGGKSGDGSTSGEDSAGPGHRTLNDAMADDTSGWKSRRCPHCKQYVDAQGKSCSACGKYLGEASAQDITRSQRCGSCGTMSFPGAISCTACGVPFG